MAQDHVASGLMVERETDLLQRPANLPSRKNREPGHGLVNGHFHGLFFNGRWKRLPVLG
jgi:hypothetical protein